MGGMNEIVVQSLKASSFTPTTAGPLDHEPRDDNREGEVGRDILIKRRRVCGDERHSTTLGFIGLVGSDSRRTEIAESPH